MPKKAKPLLDADGDDLKNYQIICYWCARKKWGFKDEFRGNEPLDDAFFCKLADVGRVALGEDHRDELRGALLHYMPLKLTRGAMKKTWQKIEKQARELIKSVGAVDGHFATSLEYYLTPSWVEQRGAPWWQTFADLLDGIAEEAAFKFWLAKEVGEQESITKPKNVDVIRLVQECTAIYVNAGGKATVSNNAGEYRGPFVEYLRRIWDVIPADQRPPSPNSFPRTVDRSSPTSPPQTAKIAKFARVQV